MLIHCLFCAHIACGGVRGSRKFCQRGSNFDNFSLFLVDDGRNDQKITINGPSSAASETPIKWRSADVLMIAQHIECLFSGDLDHNCKEILYFCDFRGGGGEVWPIMVSFKLHLKLHPIKSLIFCYIISCNILLDLYFRFN